MLAPLRDRDFLLFWSGQSVSMAGDGLFTVALAWQALELSGRPGTLAIVLLARSIPQVVLLLLGGVLTDRMPRRGLIVASDLVRGAAVGVIAGLAAAGALAVWHLVVLGAVVGAANALFFPAFTAIVPELVPTEHRPQANALVATSRLLATNLIGPAFGGVLIAVAGTAWAFTIDASTFVIAAASALAIRARSAPLPAAASVRAALGEGYAYARSAPWLWRTLVGALFGNFAMSAFNALFPVLVKEELGAGSRGFGLAAAAFGLGGGLVVVLVGRLGLPQRRVLTMFAAFITGHAALTAVGFSPAILVAASLMFVMGATFEYGNLAWTTLMQDLVPAGVLGRVASLDWMLSLGLTPLAFALAAPLAEAAGVVPVIAGAGAIAVVANIVAATGRGVLDPDRVHTGGA